MSLFAEIAKSALKSAQKHIDDVLDIRHENEDDEEEEEENVLQSNDVPLDSPPTERHDKQKLGDVHQDVKDEKHELWQWDVPSEAGVVISEPNPARDLQVHSDVAICSDSSNSLSPTDDSCYINEHHLDDFEQHKKQTKKHIDDKQITSELFESSNDNDESLPMSQFDPHRDEIVTIASSDIEVIRQHDEWSTVSSQRPPTTDTMSVSNLPISGHHTVQSLSAADGSDAVLASLKSQIGMKNRQIEDMSFSNKSLLQINTTLKQHNKKLTDKLNVMSKMQKQIVEKDNHIEELFTEGKKLSELNGRQSTEIKRLRQELNRLEVVSNARDSAVTELQIMTKKLEVTQQELVDIKTRLETVENANAKVLMDLSQTQEDTYITQRQYLDQLQKINELENVIQHFKTELALVQIEKNDLVAERDAEQRQRMKLQTEIAVKADQVGGLMTDKDALNDKIERLKVTCNNLENRIQNMMKNECHNAEQVASATGPLLNRIEELEAEIREYRNQFSVVSAKYTALNTVRNKNETLKRNFEVELRQKENQINQLTTKMYELESRFTELQFEKTEAESAWQEQLTKLQLELNAESETANVIRKNYQNQIYELEIAREHNLELKAKVSAQDAEIQGLHASIAKLSTRTPEPVYSEVDVKYSTQMPTPSPIPTSVVNFTLSSNNSQLNFVDYNYNGISNENSALRSELQNMRLTYNQATTRIQELQDEVTTLKQKNTLLIQEENQKFNKLNDDYEVLLNEYGFRVEKIEELELDIDELRKIVAQQAETVANLESLL